MSELADAPWNHRVHPQAQSDALDGAIEELGFYNYPDVFEAADGSLMLIDGHLRKARLLAKYGPDAEIEVNVTDFSEAEAKKANLTKDPLAAMAEESAEKLDALLRECKTSNEALADMLTSLASEAGCEWAQADGSQDGIDDTYTHKIIAPIYEPKGECPPVSDLVSHEKTDQLLSEIEAADLPEDVADFLRLAAERHTAFHFRRIAEFYCHATPTVQALMERSGLVIIDFDKAIENGFVHMTERLGALAGMEDEIGAGDGDA